MNNEAKILDILVGIQSDVADLKQGQAESNVRLTSLEQGQAELKQGQAESNVRLTNLEKCHVAMQADITTMKDDLTSLEKRQVAMQADITTMKDDITYIKREVADVVVLVQSTANGVQALSERQAIKHRVYDEKFEKLKVL
jgi:chromosome segregation ATPase